MKTFHFLALVLSVLILSCSGRYSELSWEDKEIVSSNDKLVSFINASLLQIADNIPEDYTFWFISSQSAAQYLRGIVGARKLESLNSEIKAAWKDKDSYRGLSLDLVADIHPSASSGWDNPMIIGHQDSVRKFIADSGYSLVFTEGIGLAPITISGLKKLMDCQKLSDADFDNFVKSSPAWWMPVIMNSTSRVQIYGFDQEEINFCVWIIMEIAGGKTTASSEAVRAAQRVFPFFNYSFREGLIISRVLNWTKMSKPKKNPAMVIGFGHLPTIVPTLEKWGVRHRKFFNQN